MPLSAERKFSFPTAPFSCWHEKSNFQGMLFNRPICQARVATQLLQKSGGRNSNTGSYYQWLCTCQRRKKKSNRLRLALLRTHLMKHSPSKISTCCFRFAHLFLLLSHKQRCITFSHCTYYTCTISGREFLCWLCCFVLVLCVTFILVERRQKSRSNFLSLQEVPFSLSTSHQQDLSIRLRSPPKTNKTYIYIQTIYRSKRKTNEI